MKQINTKKGIILTTYNQEEIDYEIEEYLKRNDLAGYTVFLNETKSLNPASDKYITEEEAAEIVGLEKKKSKKNPKNLYTNYKGMPLGIGLMGVSLYYEDPILSLKSAFEVAAPEFDFEKDFFHIFMET